ncbi:uncharacterized protein K452DRAFT_125174 [Aplosporella prunicola CBS 121167]|uniref:Secreted protein n=1 Tax=Aplosporella prunicola CBS 121167 TaxID=1176127 RepID=A0A6A6BT36_9PEZI|nr:uncharacterized protein K452DRAFT_125174 [Aplosporella prunicola CBS 121167]KAF2145771.1 hypothetical protein K452DRAFT_125174 [Aplosporella prunicola CBS 121167]
MLFVRRCLVLVISCFFFSFSSLSSLSSVHHHTNTRRNGASQSVSQSCIPGAFSQSSSVGHGKPCQTKPTRSLSSRRLSDIPATMTATAAAAAAGEAGRWQRWREEREGVGKKEIHRRYRRRRRCRRLATGFSIHHHYATTILLDQYILIAQAPPISNTLSTISTLLPTESPPSLVLALVPCRDVM